MEQIDLANLNKLNDKLFTIEFIKLIKTIFSDINMVSFNMFLSNFEESLRDIVKQSFKISFSKRKYTFVRNKNYTKQIALNIGFSYEKHIPYVKLINFLYLYSDSFVNWYHYIYQPILGKPDNNIFIELWHDNKGLSFYFDL